MVSAGGPPRPQVNEVGDVVLDNARQLRALADRVALAAFTWLQRHGPATAGQVATELERVLMPYLNRAADDVPADARRVRVLAYFLPEPR
jgi:hypothetical protein